MQHKTYKLGRGVVVTRDWGIIALIYSLILVLLLLAYAWLHIYLQQGVTLRTVRAVCSFSQNVGGSVAREACGIAQAQGNAEYLCRSDKVDGLTCWAEAK